MTKKKSKTFKKELKWSKRAEKRLKKLFFERKKAKKRRKFIFDFWEMDPISNEKEKWIKNQLQNSLRLSFGIPLNFEGNTSEEVSQEETTEISSPGNYGVNLSFSGKILKSISQNRGSKK